MNDDPNNTMPRAYTLRRVLLVAQFFLIPAGVVYLLLQMTDWTQSPTWAGHWGVSLLVIVLAAGLHAWQYRGLKKAMTPHDGREPNPLAFMGAWVLFLFTELFLAFVFFCAGCTMMIDQIIGESGFH